MSKKIVELTRRFNIRPEPNTQCKPFWLGEVAEQHEFLERVTGEAFTGKDGWLKVRLVLEAYIHESGAKIVTLSEEVSEEVSKEASQEASKEVAEEEAGGPAEKVEKRPAGEAPQRTEDGVLIADGFDSPVGSPAERAGDDVWPGGWIDATGWARSYTWLDKTQWHTGADLNWNVPHWDADRGQPVFAVAHGEVIYAAKAGGSWDEVVVVRHTLPDGRRVYSRYAHLDNMLVQKGDRVRRGQELGFIGRPAFANSAFHLHFDIVVTDVLEETPWHWPGTSHQGVIDHYVDPREFIEKNRPA